MMLVPFRSKYVYKRLERLDRSSGRVYRADPDDIPMPSVTTILDATKDKSHLKDWEDRVGKEEAERVRNDSATVGTHMHNVIERLLLNRPLEVPRTWLHVKGYRMGHQLIEHFFPHVDEVWGAEVSLYVPNTYAGTSDCVGIYKGKPCIMDFKQTNRPKKREWIEDYFLQLAAYAVAHDRVHGTKIDQGVIMMMSQGGEPQEFITVGREFDGYKDKWWRRVEQYQKRGQGSEVPGPSAIGGGETP
jgi:genome maintenance exonuclease 1